MEKLYGTAFKEFRQGGMKYRKISEHLHTPKSTRQVHFGPPGQHYEVEIFYHQGSVVKLMYNRPRLHLGVTSKDESEAKRILNNLEIICSEAT